MTVSLAPRGRRTDPPRELIEELTDETETGARRDFIERATDLIDTASAVTDKVERVVELGRGLVEGRGPGGQLVAQELDDLLGLLKRLDRSGRSAEAIRLARPLCRLFALMLRWAALAEALRIVLHAATALADERTKAWALHELGTLHQGVDDLDRARQLLGEARDIRKRIGDAQGLQATEHNLKVLARRGGALPSLAMLIVIGAVVTAALVLGLAGTLGGGSSTPGVSALATPTALAFGIHEVKRTTSAESVIWSNHGSAALAPPTVKLTGADPGDFAIFADGCRGKPITPGGFCKVSVTFMPTAVGSRTASLRFAGTGRPSIQQVVTLSGRGATPPAVSVSPASLVFGSWAIDQPSSPKTVTLANNGSAALAVAPVTLGGADAGDFAIAGDGCSKTTVAPGRWCTVGVTFTPTAPGTHTATLILADNANPSVHEVIGLSGSGTGAPSAALSPGPFAFGSVLPGQTSNAQTITLSNSGTAPLAVTSVTRGGANPGDFAISSDGCSMTIVPPSGSCPVTVTFTPAATGHRSATLDFNDNDPTRSQSASLSGTGIDNQPR